MAELRCVAADADAVASLVGSALAASSVACTSCAVRTIGAPLVTIVAVSWSPRRRSANRTVRPSLTIWTPRLSSSPCVKRRAWPSAPRMSTEKLDACSTSASRTSVTKTGRTVVDVVTVAVPFIPGLRSDTAMLLPSTVKRKSGGTVSSFVPRSSRTTSLFPSTAITSNLRVSTRGDRLGMRDAREGERQAQRSPRSGTAKSRSFSSFVSSVGEAIPAAVRCSGEDAFAKRLAGFAATSAREASIRRRFGPGAAPKASRAGDRRTVPAAPRASRTSLVRYCRSGPMRRARRALRAAEGRPGDMGARAVIAALALALAACAPLTRLEPPEVVALAVRNVEIRLPTIRVDTELTLRNPNAVSVSIASLDADLEIGGERAGTLRLASPVTLPAGASAQVELSAVGDAAIALTGVGRALGSGRPLDYALARRAGARRRPRVPVRAPRPGVRAAHPVTTLAFTKMHGLGNDFVVVDAMRQPFDARRRRRSARSPTAASASAATRCWSSSAATRGDVDFRYRIFNADGGEVEQCGNGARCFVVFVRDHGLTDKREIRVETAGGVIVPRLDDDGEVTVDMGVPRFAPADVPFTGGTGGVVEALDVDGDDGRRSRRCRWAIRTRCRSSPTSTPRR